MPWLPPRVPFSRVVGGKHSGRVARGSGRREGDGRALGWRGGWGRDWLLLPLPYPPTLNASHHPCHPPHQAHLNRSLLPLSLLVTSYLSAVRFETVCSAVIAVCVFWLAASGCVVLGYVCVLYRGHSAHPTPLLYPCSTSTPCCHSCFPRSCLYHTPRTHPRSQCLHYTCPLFPALSVDTLRTHMISM